MLSILSSNLGIRSYIRELNIVEKATQMKKWMILLLSVCAMSQAYAGSSSVLSKEPQSPGLSAKHESPNTITYAIQDGVKAGDRFNHNINPNMDEIKIFTYTTQEQILKGQPMKLYSTMESAFKDGVGVYQEHKTEYPLSSGGSEISIKINMLQKTLPYIVVTIFVLLGLIMFITRTKIYKNDKKDQFEQIIEEAKLEVNQEAKAKHDVSFEEEFAKNKN